MTVAEMLSRMSSREFSEWAAFDHVERESVPTAAADPAGSPSKALTDDPDTQLKAYLRKLS